MNARTAQSPATARRALGGQQATAGRRSNACFAAEVQSFLASCEAAASERLLTRNWRINGERTFAFALSANAVIMLGLDSRHGRDVTRRD